MLKKMKKQPLLFVEILFNKTRRECCEINSNALAKEVEILKKETHKLDCDYDNVNIKSMDHPKGFNKNIGDALGDDEADVVISYDIGSRSENISEDKGEKLLKTRRKNITLNNDIKQRVKDLYEKYKDCENCKDLISKDLDAEGGISTFQVSRVFKELGIKLPRKKVGCAISKMRLGCEDSTVESKDIISDLLQQKTMHSRKRIKTFSEEQEIMIKTLYEEYKYNKRCSYLIAKALDIDGAFSTNQVSKKLVQLGLLPPRNMSNNKKMATNEVMNNSSMGGASDAYFYYDDDEPLSLLKRRYKGNSRYNFSISKGVDVGDDSSDDNEPLLTLMKRRKEAKAVKMDEVNVTDNTATEVKDDTLNSSRDEVLDGLEDDEEAGCVARRPGRRKLVLFLDEE